MIELLLYVSLALPDRPHSFLRYLVLSVGKRSAWLLRVDDAHSLFLTTPEYLRAMGTCKFPLFIRGPGTLAVISKLARNADAAGQAASPAVAYALARLRLILRDSARKGKL